MTSEHTLAAGTARRKAVWHWLRSHKALTLLLFFTSLILFDLIYLFLLWPDWTLLAKGAIPESRFIREFRARQAELPPRKATAVVWIPRESLGLTVHALRVFVMAEDSRFYEHPGIDLEAIRLALEYDWKKGSLTLGGSTITQQTVKNMFLSFSRNPLRKFHEVLLALAMEQNLPKKRILLLYLNIAEFGPGIFGIEAAARHYFHTGSANLTRGQLVALAASLPSPRKNNPATHTRSFARRQARIGRTVDHYMAMVETRGGRAASGVPPASAATSTTTDTAGAPAMPPKPEPFVMPQATEDNEATVRLHDELERLKWDLMREEEGDDQQQTTD